MDRLGAMETFVRIVDAGSLSEAARQTGRSLASVVRALAALEAHLGSRLLQRSTRRLSLTEEGADYLERARQVLQLVDEAESSARKGQTEPSGRLMVSAPRMFGRLHVAPALFELLAREPALSATLLLDDRQIDLIAEGVDAAVRIGELADSSLRAVRIGQTRCVWCASPDYLARHGEPATRADLAGHALLEGVRDGRLPGSEHGRFACNGLEALIEAALRGHGIVNVFSYQAMPHLRDGSLREVLPGQAGGPKPIHVVYPRARLLSARVRAFRDHLAGQGGRFEF